MTTEKKEKELGIKYQTPCHGIGDCEFEARQAATEMAEWMVEKACEWLKDNVNDYLDWYDWEQCRVNKDDLLYDFKKAMKGGDE